MRLSRSLVCKSIAVTAFVTLNSAAVFAADTGMRVGLVDIERAISQSKSGGEAQKKYAGEVKKAQESIESKKKELQKSQESFEKQKESLNEKARADKAEQLISMDKDLKRTLQDSQEQLRRMNNSIVGDLVKELRSVIKDVGKAEGFTVILEQNDQSVLYADTQIDITDRVVKKFDEAKK